jgi:diaminopimelate epimerase
MGNPHAVVPVDDLADFDLERFGPLLEVHPSFPAKTNVHFVQVLAPDHLVMRVWERGAGPTLACGTGACATLVACHLLGLADRRARLDLPGGPLQIHWDPSSGHVIMDGPAEHVFDGAIPSTEAVQEARRQAAGAGLQQPATAQDKAPEASFGPANDLATSQAPEMPPAGTAPVAETIQCAVVCVHGCIRPEACPSAEARAKVAALLAGSSLDDLVAIASNSLESRIRSRISGPGEAG